MPERVVGRRRVEVDVRVQLLLALDDRLDAFATSRTTRASPARAPSSCDICAQMRRARILGGVDAVAEARDLLLRCELAADERSMRSARGVLAELEQQLHHLLVGAAVERALRGADAGDDGRVDVGERRGGHAGGEGRGVQLVVGVQHERDVDRPHRGLARPLAAEHVEEVGGVAEHRVGRDRTAAGRSRPHVATRLADLAVRRTALRYGARGELSSASGS